jgi:hypothetical protein
MSMLSQLLSLRYHAAAPRPRACSGTTRLRLTGHISDAGKTVRSPHVPGAVHEERPPCGHRSFVLFGVTAGPARAASL